jgi:hypothetical protein
MPLVGGATTDVLRVFRERRSDNARWLELGTVWAHREGKALRLFSTPLRREYLARSEDARVLLRQIFDTEADLTPDLVAHTLTVRLHHLTQATHDRAIEPLLAELDATQTVFPGTSLTLVFKLGSA